MPLSDHPHILDRILSHAAWNTLPTLRQTTKEVASFANAVLYRHVVVNVRGTTLELLDPFRMERVPGLRLERGHADYPRVLERLSKYTRTFDFVALGLGDLEGLARAAVWRDVKRIAESKRIRSSEPITYLLDTPEEVVLHYTANSSPYSKRELLSTLFKRLVLQVNISDALTRRFHETTAAGRINSIIRKLGFLCRPREIIILFTQGSGEPIPWWKDVQYKPGDHPVRPFDLLLDMAFCPWTDRAVTLVGLETMDPRILYLAPWSTEPAASRLIRLRKALRRPMERGKNMYRNADGTPASDAGHIDLKLVALDDYRHTTGLEEYEWRLMTTKPCVKLPFPSTWSLPTCR